MKLYIYFGGWIYKNTGQMITWNGGWCEWRRSVKRSSLLRMTKRTFFEVKRVTPSVTTPDDTSLSDAAVCIVCVHFVWVVSVVCHCHTSADEIDVSWYEFVAACCTFCCHIVKAGFYIAIVHLYTYANCILSVVCLLLHCYCWAGQIICSVLCTLLTALSTRSTSICSFTWMQPLSLSVGRGALKPGAFS